MKKTILFYGVSFLLLCTNGIALAKHSESKKNSIIVATKKMPIIDIKLPSNPSTGYSWFLRKYDDQFLTPISEKYYPPKQSMPGKEGYDLWRFRVLSRTFVFPKITFVKFIYLRPWTLEGSKKIKIAVITRKEK